MTQPVAMITGVGEGTGAAIARRFAGAGYQVAMLARDEVRLAILERELGNAVAFPCDVSDITELIGVFEAVKRTLGAPSVLVHNAVRATFERFDVGDPEELERNFRVNTTALLYLARAVVPDMLEHGEGAILVTGNTAAFRGVPSHALFAPSKAAQRILAQALARDLGPRGIHVAYFNIDAVINVPWTRDRFHPDKPDAFFIEPSDIAGEVLHVAQQPPSAWSFDVEIRPFGERW